MPSSPLGSTNGRTTSGVACHHSPWTASTVKLRQAWHAITTFGQHTQSNDVGHGMSSSPLGSTHGRTTSGVACHHRLWTAHTVGNVKRGMTSQPLDNTHGRQRRAWHNIIVEGQHTRSNDVRRGMPLSPLGSTNSRKPWGWHAITALGLHAWLDDVGLGITLQPLYSTRGRQRRA